MDASLFAKMLSDKSITDLKKLGYKYPKADLQEFVALLKENFYHKLPLNDFDGERIVFLESVTQVSLSAVRILLTPQRSDHLFGAKAMEDEILSTFRIEQINTTRDSVRRVLAGHSPRNEDEHRVYGMKRGLEFIADPSHTITEGNLYRLYQMTIGEFLPEEDQLLPGNRYRHDAVYVVGAKVEHTGLPCSKLPEYMAALIKFAQEGAETNALLKAAILHFYLAYLHPYFDGNGRMARLLHLWYLVQQGYSSALFVPLSRYVEESRNRYYNAFSLVERNQEISGIVDLTPFLTYFIEQVYRPLGENKMGGHAMDSFKEALAQGQITEKEAALWQFVLSCYGDEEFSTKQLEKDFGNAAYATIRGFVLKFESLGMLASTRYGNRVKYRVI
ncbi:Fic family protein [Gemmiger sp. An50]|uniref:Fic family protein n=1 Tax=Gemmiger sp. An50 TaxID=1965639 RepID=UPI000B37C69C|nr:Fic family protein [Gemmiger sp. An50]OUN83081.1 cell filamentation protein Fic [Gemmiger sp. An50]